MPYTTLVIDDEDIARQRLVKLLGSESEINVLDTAINGIDAVKKITEHKPDLIFLDIKMPGLNGFEVLEHIDHQPIVIFTTAYDEYALQAFEENAIAYLLKPVEKLKLNQAIQKLAQFSSKKIDTERLRSPNEKRELKHFVSKLGSKIRFINKSDVCYIEAKDKHTFVHLENGTEYLIDQTLTMLENILEHPFLRIHRSVMLNSRFVKEAEKVGDGKFLFTLSDSKRTQVQSTTSYLGVIKEHLGL